MIWCIRSSSADSPGGPNSPFLNRNRRTAADISVAMMPNKLSRAVRARFITAVFRIVGNTTFIDCYKASPRDRWLAGKPIGMARCSATRPVPDPNRDPCGSVLSVTTSNHRRRPDHQVIVGTRFTAAHRSPRTRNATLN
jgi:hypothetical protein